MLPAIRHGFTVRTADGETLAAEVSLPVAGAPAATVICLHPLPLEGGSSDSHVLRKMAWRLPAMAQTAVVRFNFRGTTSSIGSSTGTFDQADAEGLDLAAILDWTRARGLLAPWLVGWSFGTDVTLKHGNVDPVAGATLLSPPLRWSDESTLLDWARTGRPLRVLVPELDDFLRPEQAQQRFSLVPQAEVVPVAGARHLWVGEKYVALVLNDIVAQVAPHYAPLPTEWDGPMETGVAHGVVT